MIRNKELAIALSPGKVITLNGDHDNRINLRRGSQAVKRLIGSAAQPVQDRLLELPITTLGSEWQTMLRLA